MLKLDVPPRLTLLLGVPGICQRKLPSVVRKFKYMRASLKIFGSRCLSGSGRVATVQRASIALCGASVLFSAGARMASAGQSAPSMKLPESGVVLRDTPNPLRYFDAAGRKSAVFGRQNGQFEAWIYPVKVLHNFRLEFQQEGQPEAVRGENILREVVTRPESTSLVYVHPNFTVREIIWAPLDEPALLVYFDVDSSKPLDITAAFVPDFKPMWPASFGGQHSSWLAEEKAFALTDVTEHPTALVGSPAVRAYTEFTDHQLASGETILRVRFESRKVDAGPIPLALALSMDGAANATAIYRDVLARSRELFEKRVAHHREFLERTFSFESPDAELNQAVLWSKLTLDAGWVCHSNYGCGLVAGYGPSGTGERPGFDWWFGGDAMMSSWALEDMGDLDGALQALRFLKARQRADGKVMHEMPQSVDLLDWFGKFRYAYYHADTTPMYLYSLGEYWQRTGDAKFLEEFWPSIQKAYSYCLSTVDSADGLMDNTKAGLAAVEVGVLRGKVVKDIYLEGFWVGALDAFARMAAAKGEKSFAEEAAQRAAKARDSVEKAWWSADQRAYTFGISTDGRRTDLIGVWPSVMLALSPEMNSSQSRAAAASMAAPAIAADWGARWLANDHPLYDPLSYNNGTAWPFMSGFASWAQYRHGLPLAAFALWSSVARLTGLTAPGAVPELMNGDRYLAGEFAVPHQLFSSDGVLLPAMRGLLGLEVHGPAAAIDHELQFSFAPNLPADWPFLRFERYAIGKGHLSGEILQEAMQTTLDVKYDGDSAIVGKLAPSVPAAARIKSVQLNHKPAKYSVRDLGSFVRVELAPVKIESASPTVVTVEYEGGIGIVPPAPRSQPGERSSALKILGVNSYTQSPRCLVQISVAGLAGRTYPLQLISSMQDLRAAELRISKTGSGYIVDVPFDADNASARPGYVTRQVCLTN